MRWDTPPGIAEVRALAIGTWLLAQGAKPRDVRGQRLRKGSRGANEAGPEWSPGAQDNS
jgi:hypothetical protein